ncbi:cytochrome P450 [Phanerochaete sordida]|uniref:Cytochrome P450 n=1 Tax=Phanerochaete sordida TaxID=48140 RepID=A0A9P3GQ60_9APHY|nr:cytochrome P450 [Phanerochaete sordida]
MAAIELALLSSDVLTSVKYLAFGAAIVLLLYSFFSSSDLRHIPTVGGSSLPLLSFKATFDFLRDGNNILQRGYNKYEGGIFKVAFTDRWLVVVPAPKLIEEMLRLPDDTISSVEALEELSGFKYVFGPSSTVHDPFYVEIMKRQLNKHLPNVFGDIYDEIRATFEDMVPSSSKEWIPVHAIKVIREAVARSSNRAFVGEPLCRDRAYLELLAQFINDLAKAMNLLACFPPMLKYIVARIATHIDCRLDEGMQILGPAVEERKRLMAQYGEGWSDKPSDMLQWVIDELESRSQPIKQVILTMLFVNFTSINTTSNSFTHALYYLAASPELIAPLRAEIEAVIAEEGLTKNAMGKLVRVDSFLRESLRHSHMIVLPCMRKALKPFKFSDGTHIPAGTILVSPAAPMHGDDGIHDDATAFRPWRYVPTPEFSTNVAQKQLVTTGADYIPFGHGKHACPGRFFAAMEMKAMLVFVVLHYDVKFAAEGVRPQNVTSVLSTQPHEEARVLFRNRQSSVL